MEGARRRASAHPGRPGMRGSGPPAAIGRRRAAPVRPARQALRGGRFGGSGDHLRHLGGEGEGAAERRRLDHDETHVGNDARRVRRRGENLSSASGRLLPPDGEQAPTGASRSARATCAHRVDARRPGGRISAGLRKFLPASARRTTSIPAMAAEAVDAGPPVRLLIADRSPVERRATRERLLHAGGMMSSPDGRRRGGRQDGRPAVPAVLVTDVSLVRATAGRRADALGRRRPAWRPVLRRAVDSGGRAGRGRRTGALGFLVKGRDEPGRRPRSARSPRRGGERPGHGDGSFDARAGRGRRGARDHALPAVVRNPPEQAGLPATGASGIPP